jgi:hypothetical protein
VTVVEREVIAPTAPAVTEADLLSRTADLLEEFGWVQGDIAQDEEGASCGSDRGVSFCVGGAYLRALQDLGVFADTSHLDWNEDLEPLRVALRHEEHVQHWNDAKGRTKAEVVGALREAAARAEA